MNKRRHTKLLREGPYAAEVDVEFFVKRCGEETFKGHPGARVFSLTPVSR